MNEIAVRNDEQYDIRMNRSLIRGCVFHLVSYITLYFRFFSYIHLSSFRYFKATFLSFCRLRYNVRMTNLKITQISQCCQHQVWRLIVWETYMNNRRQTPNKDESSFSTLSTIALDLIVETFVFTMVYSVPDYDKIDS